MPSKKLDMIAQIVDQTTNSLCGDWERWTDFLNTAARLYKYPYHEQLMIFAQRPDATACASYEIWTQRMGRYVRRGTHGIALLTDGRSGLWARYVFDISDTGEKEGSRSPRTWTMSYENTALVQKALSQVYHVPQETLPEQIREIAVQFADTYWTEYKDDIVGKLAGSLLERYDRDNLSVRYRESMSISSAYILLIRCGLDPKDHLDMDSARKMFAEFSTPGAVQTLGVGISEYTEQVLRFIEVTIREQERRKARERRETHGVEVQADGGRPDPRLGTGGDVERTPEQIRQDAQDISEGTSSSDLQRVVTENDTIRPLPRDWGDGPSEIGLHDARNDGRSGSDGAAESPRPHEVGGPDEHAESSGRGSYTEGTGIHLLTESSDQISLFTTVQEEIAENVKTSSAFSFAQADIDQVLRMGGNTNRQRERIVAAFEKQKSTAEIAVYLQNLYTGGNGIGSITAWYAEDGIHLSHGKSARYDKSAQVISWESAAERIGQLLQTGQFATNVELSEAEGYERSLLAEKFWNLYHDFSDEAKESGYLPSLANNPRRGFPEESAWITEQLNRPEFRQNLAEEYAAFWTAYQQDRDLLRFHYHKPKEIWENLRDLSLPRTTFSSQLTEAPSVRQFITEDEIDVAMTRGSGFAGGKGRVFTFFQEPHTDKEKVDFLKHEYGIGGRSHALSDAMRSDEWHDGKGLHYKKADCPDVHFTWEKVAKRITNLIQKGRYLTEQEQEEYDKIQAEKTLTEEDALQAQQPDPAVWEYNGVRERHPDDIGTSSLGKSLHGCEDERMVLRGRGICEHQWPIQRHSGRSIFAGNAHESWDVCHGAGKVPSCGHYRILPWFLYRCER